MSACESAYGGLESALGAAAVRKAELGDAVGGVQPSMVATVDGTEQVAAAMRIAAEHQLRVVPRGAGSKLDWGAAPEAVDLVLDLSAASGVLEHASGDLVLRVAAGTPLAQIQQVVAAAGQQLAIDHPLPAATAGGVIATGLSGPCRHSFGEVRDLLLGITVVLADATVAASGGKVVKNVAGYDLAKLYTGSFGTLGVITEAIFRLHPLPEQRQWISVRAEDADTAGQVTGIFRRCQAVPAAVELDQPDRDAPIAVCAQLEGRGGATHQRARELADAVATETGCHSEVAEQPPRWWGQLPVGVDQATVLRCGAEPVAITRLLSTVRKTAPWPDLVVRGAAGRGVLYAGLPSEHDPHAVAEWVDTLRQGAGYAVVMRAPEDALALVDPWGPVAQGAQELMRRTKEQFDPTRRLAPGRFVGGI